MSSSCPIMLGEHPPIAFNRCPRSVNDNTPPFSSGIGKILFWGAIIVLGGFISFLV